MKVVIDTNVIISAALGSRTCSKVILWAMDSAQIMGPKIVLIELERFSKKLKKQQQSYSAIRQIESFFEIYLSFCIIKNPKKILDISTDKPDNHFLSLSFEENAVYVTGDKLALQFAKINNINATPPTNFIKEIK